MEEQVKSEGAVQNECQSDWDYPYVTLENIGKYVGQKVVIKGWLRKLRSSGKILFLQMRDGTATIQVVVVKSECSPEEFQVAKSLTQESSFEIVGVVREDQRSACGYEIQALHVRLISGSVDYPITPKEHGTEFLMDHRHLWIRR